MALPISPPFPPMEARTVDTIPTGREWLYEPKWDGFRCLAFRDGESVELQSKSGQPLTRYFPEVAEAIASVDAAGFVLDGEIMVPVGNALSFDDLLQRIHPAESRVRKLSLERPAIMIVFDLLVDERLQSLVELPLSERRGRTEQFGQHLLEDRPTVRLSPATTDPVVVQQWFAAVGPGLDGVIAKRLDKPYMSGERTGMVKIKNKRSADCVVGGFRYADKEPVVGSMLLGLYDDEGLLQHVGFSSSFTSQFRKEITPKLEALRKPPGFTGKAPGGPSRWSTKRSAEWEPIDPVLVVEVEFDHYTGGRFRHGTRFIRWRPDKSPRSCTLEQVGVTDASALELLDD